MPLAEKIYLSLLEQLRHVTPETYRREFQQKNIFIQVFVYFYLVFDSYMIHVVNEGSGGQILFLRYSKFVIRALRAVIFLTSVKNYHHLCQMFDSSTPDTCTDF